MSKSANSAKYACPHCGSVEYITAPNSYDVYLATAGGLQLQESAPINEKFQLHCRECSERAPAAFENVAG